MPICPNCKKIINHLQEMRTGYERCDMSVDKEGILYWKNEEFSGDDNLLEFYCPECSKELSFTEKEAEEFLKNKDEVAEMVLEKIEKIKDENTKDKRADY